MPASDQSIGIVQFTALVVLAIIRANKHPGDPLR